MFSESVGRTAPTHILTSFPEFLTQSEASDISAKVRSLQSKWLPCGSDPAHPYLYFIGSANYLAASVVQYHQRKNIFNPLLEPLFSEVYQKLNSHFASYFNCHIKKPSELSWPGFHIYHGTTMPNGGSVHWDRGQHAWVQKNYFSEVNLEEGYSFTLPVELTEGSGLRIWDIPFTVEASRSLGAHTKSQIAEQGYFVEYKVGDLYVFNSNYLHQVAPNNTPVSEKRRITLQGHLLRCSDGSMLMFW